MNEHTQYLIEALTENYDPEHDLFSNQPIQMNHIDARLLDIIQALLWDIEHLETRLRALEIFTGMVAPEPLTPAPADAHAAVTDEFESVSFHAGDAGYAGSPETAQVGADGSLFF